MEKSASFHRPLRIPGKRIIITKRMIESAIANTKSNSAASRWIGVDYNTYKKYAKRYGLFEKNLNPAGKGIRKGWSGYNVKLEDIFKNVATKNYTISTIKRALIDRGYMLNECSICGWNEQNILTNTVCLILDFIDGAKDNKSLENMRLLCPNCYYSNNGKFLNSRYFCK